MKTIRISIILLTLFLIGCNFEQSETVVEHVPSPKSDTANLATSEPDAPQPVASEPDKVATNEPTKAGDVEAANSMSPELLAASKSLNLADKSPAEPPTQAEPSSNRQGDNEDGHHSPLEGYVGIIVEPLEVGDEGWYAMETSEEVSQYLDLSIKKAVLANYNIATEPAEGIARLETSLVDAASLEPMQTGGQLKGVVLLTKISDSLTGKELMRFVQVGKRRPLSYEVISRWRIGSRIVDRWSDEFREMLNQQRQ